MEKHAKNNRLYRLDALRAFSVIIVVLGHSTQYFPYDQIGVIIFFVISGFIITRLLISEQNRTNQFNVVAFYMRRLLKIVPPLLALIVIPSILVQVFQHTRFPALGSQIFFYFNYWIVNNGQSGYLRGSGVVWSLSIEEQFYLLIALAWVCIVRMKSSAKWLLYLYAGIFLASSVSKFFIDYAQNDRLIYGTQNRISAIALGGILAICISNPFNFKLENKLKLSVPASTFLLTISLALFLTSASFIFLNSSNIENTNATAGNDFVWHLVFAEFGALFLVWSAVLDDGWPKLVEKISKNSVIQMVGLASYSIYLVHHVVIFAISQTVEDIPSRWIQVIMRVLIGLCVGILAHHVFDKPFEKYRTYWRNRAALSS